MSEPVDVVLVPGFWLGGWAWDGVVPFLEQLRLRPHPVTLPGREPHGPTPRVTLEHQIATVREVVAGTGGKVLLVGHSGGVTVVNGYADTEPERVAGMVFVDDAPLPDGGTFAVDVPRRAPGLPLPPWSELAQMGLSPTGLDAHTREVVRDLAAAEPAGVLTSTARLRNPRRKDIPVTMVCTSMPAATVQDAITAGAPFTEELAGRDLMLLDMPTGHWPMFSRGEDLAHAIALAARR
ncbi:alpha/beta fold hydrolase [Georgenia deserti]|uniref:Alpha/beta fold hydrolase n=1 Tax=Georgenia deserti TaxID=2093781 RepID=A0ABW4L4I9_9MICO